MIKRNVNVDLFRIIATLLVVLLHVLGIGGILKNASPGGTIYWAAWFLEICACCAVNCFALISGYIMVDKNIKLKNIINMWFQVIFYSLLFTSLFFVFIPESRNIRTLVTSALPILGKQWWYISAYFALFFFIPFLNKAIDNISKENFKKFLMGVLTVMFFDAVVPNDAFLLNDGYSAIWLMVVYLFGAYIRKYNLDQKITALKSILGYLAMVILSFISKMGVSFLTKIILGQSIGENILISYTSITILLSAIFLFLFCLNLKINNLVAKLVIFFSPATLGVYLIHVHPLVFKYIFTDAFISLVDTSAIIMLLYVLFGTLSIFMSCSVIDLLRIKFFKLIKINKLCEIIESKINSLYLKLFKE